MADQTTTNWETDSREQAIKQFSEFAANNPTFRALQEEYEIKPTDVAPAEVTTPVTINFETLCTNQSPVYRKGRAIPHQGHSGPLMFVRIGQPVKSDQFKEAWGYIQITAYDPVNDEKLLISHTLPINDEDKTKPGDHDIVQWFKTLKPGALFTIANMRTSHGYKVFRPVPVTPADS